jgi:hypothetical protein
MLHFARQLPTVRDEAQRNKALRPWGVTSESSDEPVSLDDRERVTLSKWTADAVVLYNWLMRVDIEAVPHEHRGELQALTDLLTALTEHVEGAFGRTAVE